MPVVHIGLTPAMFGARRDTIRGAAHLYTDDDGWNVWGEAPGTDVNDPTTLHVNSDSRPLGAAIDFALRLWSDHENGGGFLVPMNASQHGGSATYDGVLVSVTGSVYSHEYLVIDEAGPRLRPAAIVADDR